MKAKIFISCGQKKKTSERKIAKVIARQLSAIGFNPYVAVEEQSLKGLKDNIFTNLSTSEYFLFIDFKREKISGKEYRGSLFSHQELALASYLDIQVIGFQEYGVKLDDGIIKFLQTNCITFKSRKTLPEQVSQAIKDSGWKTDWKNQLILEVNPELSKARRMPEQRNATFFPIRAINLNPYVHAKNCYCYIKKVENLTNGHIENRKTVENKWSGYHFPSAQILPSSERNIDGFYVYHSEPTIARFNLFTDSGNYNFKLDNSSDYEITYLLLSDNFPIVESKFRLHLGQKISDITFKKV